MAMSNEEKIELLEENKIIITKRIEYLKNAIKEEKRRCVLKDITDSLANTKDFFYLDNQILGDSDPRIEEMKNKRNLEGCECILQELNSNISILKNLNKSQQLL